MQGRIVRQDMDLRGTGRFVVEGAGLANGLYHYRLTGGIDGSGMLAVQR